MMLMLAYLDNKVEQCEENRPLQNIVFDHGILNNGLGIRKKIGTC